MIWRGYYSSGSFIGWHEVPAGSTPSVPAAAYGFWGGYFYSSPIYTWQ